MGAVTVGQVGLGKMGLNVAKRLVDEGFEVIGYDVDPDAVAALEENGGKGADSNADLAANVDIVLSALSYPEIIEEVYLGESGIVEGAHDDLICMEQSTVPPEPIRELSADFEELGIDLLDVPFLSGGPEFARNGTMVLPVGGDRDVYANEHVQAVLDALSREFHYMGPVGHGKVTKLVSNILALGNSMLALEALSLGVAQGLDPETLYNTLKYSAGSSVMYRIAVVHALNRDFDPIFPVKYTQKDLRYALRTAEEIDFPLSITSSILQQVTTAAAKGYGDEDSPAVVKVYEEYFDGEVESDALLEVPSDDPVYNT